MFTKEQFQKALTLVGEWDERTQNIILMDCFTHILDPEWAERSWDITYTRPEAFMYIAAIYSRSGWSLDCVEDMLNKHITEPKNQIKLY